MLKKIEWKFVLITYVLMLIGWGLTVLFGVFGLTLKNSPWLYVLYLTGGWSPTIASYLASKKCGKVAGFKDWLKQLFTFKASLLSYGLVFALLIVYFVPLCLIAGFTQQAPIYNIILMLPVMFMGGGLEETGWRYILQPGLQKRYGFFISNTATAFIWAFWHLPLFFIATTVQSQMSFLFFAIGVLGSAFALGAIRDVTENIWLCILFHSFSNAVQSVFVVKQSLFGIAVTAVITVVLSCVVRHIIVKKQQLSLT